MSLHNWKGMCHRGTHTAYSSWSTEYLHFCSPFESHRGPKSQVCRGIGVGFQGALHSRSCQPEQSLSTQLLELSE